MALTTYTTATNVIGSLGTTPEDRPGMTDQQLKDKFDENAVNIAAFLNTLINELKATTAGKGASAIGIQDAGSLITATNVEAALAEIAGAGRTTETLKGLATLISTHEGKLVTGSGGVHGLEVEYGTWTPAITGSTGVGTFSPTYGTRSANYIKIGKLIMVEFTLVLTSYTGEFSGGFRLTGLPFTPASDSSAIALSTLINLTFGSTVPVARILSNGIAINKVTTGATIGGTTTADLLSGFTISGSGTYRIS